jgi:PAS domain S-box-containing protein
MLTRTYNRLQWLVVAPAALALAGVGVLVWTVAGAGLDTQLLAACLIVGLALTHFLVTERARAREREHMLELLGALNRPGDLRSLIRDVTGLVQSWAGCSAVGVRLSDGEDFPYFETRGFDREFVEAENHLCARDLAGQAVLDSVGNPVLECMCGNILRGRFDPTKPFFTPNGSFYSNHTTRLLATTTEKDRQARTRNRCNGEGYESVVLIPLRAGRETFGLLQLNDRETGKFPPRTVRFLEEVSDVIALSLGQRNAQSRSARNEAQYRQIVETAEEGILSLDAAGRIDYLNARSAEALSTTVEAAKGRDIEAFILAEDLPAHRRRMQERRAGKSDKYQVRFRRPGGPAVWCQISVRPNLDDAGAFQGSFAMVSNITEQKLAEAEREQLQAQLRQAQKLDSIGRLAGGVAHDFNNMLSVINGHAEMALEQVSPSDPVYDDLWNILNAGRRSASLTRQLLAFARQQPSQPKVVNLNQVVANMLKLLGRLIGEDIELVWRPDPDLWAVRIDPAQIDQIMANLAVNARDAIAGVGKVSMSTSNQTLTTADCGAIHGGSPGRYVRLAVTDTGCGMDKPTMEHIFEPFFTTKKVGDGTGLGLATVYGVVKQNGGLIHVYSEIGQGTTFSIYLPRCESALSTVSESESVVEPARGSETLLVVEDEETVLELVRGQLQGAGYTVLAATTPEEALSIQAEHEGRIDLLLTDLVMPSMNGLELARRLTMQRPEIKCLYMSGYPADVAVHRGQVDVGLRLIEKPFTLRTLTRNVRQALDESATQV